MNKQQSHIRIAVLAAVFAATLSAASAALVVPYVSLTNMTSSQTWPSGADYTDNLGFVFKTGSSGPFPIDWVDLSLSTSSYPDGGPVSLTLSLRDATSSTAYSAFAGTTAYATDTFSFNTPTTNNTNFKLSLTAAELPNITGYDLAADTVYSLVLYSPSATIALRRATTSGLNNTANGLYDMGEGFTMLNSFRDNRAVVIGSVPNLTTNSVAYGIAFGSYENPVPVPEPGTWAAAALLAGGAAYVRWRKRRDEEQKEAA